MKLINLNYGFFEKYINECCELSKHDLANMLICEILNTENNVKLSHYACSLPDSEGRALYVTKFGLNLVKEQYSE